MSEIMPSPASAPPVPPAPPASSAARILVIDDEPDLRTLYELTLLRQGYRVESAADLLEAREHLKAQRFDAVITDMRLPDGLGLELLRDLAAEHRPERCVVITAHGSAENAVDALKSGAFDYLTKPVDLTQFRSVVAAAVQESRNAGLPDARGDARAPPAGAAAAGLPSLTGAAALQKLVGASPAMQSVKSRIVKVAGSMAPILIRGESGTGKELVARAVHGCSHRAGGPFVAVNCGAIPENLLEAEFFGARKGAYTGAAQDRLGLFQAAKGGTLFLDEIGDLPLAMQSKLLRAIQERTVRPLGSSQEDAVDVRIVSATHKNLAAGVEAGVFRQDLYYRLNVIEIFVPALRERLEDLPALCQALLARICQESGLPMPELTAPAIEQLRSLPFNGNVRELENILHRAVALGEDHGLYFDGQAQPVESVESVESVEQAGQAEQAKPPKRPEQATPVPDNLQNFLDQQERGILTRVLRETGFNRTAAASRLGLSLRQIRYRIARLAIVTPGHDDDAAESLDELA